MKKIKLADGLTLDPAGLVNSRMLVQANSGGGKSWLLRLIAEQAAGQIQTVILDPEGEFVTLRERHDFLLVGAGGEIPCDPRSAALLARKLLELQASAVIDLSELKLAARRSFVRNFLDSLIALPKALWRPLLVMLDESHLFCPERSAGEAESTQAVIDLMSLGRKRGYCGVLATQRLSKLHKDAEAECNNVFVGRSWLDVDVKRAAKLLGIPDAAAMHLRDLEPGQFKAFGPALSANGVATFKANPVQTTHPTAGQRHKLTPPKPSEAVKKIVAELADLPQQVEAELKTTADLRAEVSLLKKELAAKERAAPAPPAAKGDPKSRSDDVRTIRTLRHGLEQAMKVVAKINAHGFDATGVDPETVRKAVQSAADQIVRSAEAKIAARKAEFDKLKKEAGQVLEKLQRLLANDDVKVEIDVRHNEPFTVAPATTKPAKVPKAGGTIPLSGLTPSQQAVLDAAASFPNGATRQRIAVYSGRSLKSSSFTGAFPTLEAAGLIRREGERYLATPEGAAAANASTGTSLEDWLRKLKPSEAKVLACIVAAYPGRVTRAEVSERTGQSQASSSFTGAFPALRDLELIEGQSDFRATDHLMDGGAA